MKKKFPTVLLTMICALCVCFGLAACNDNEVSPPSAPIYRVSVASGEGFTVSGINADGYTKDADVSFTVTVTDDSKQISEVKANGNALETQSDGQYKFKMPENDVIISVELVNKPPVLSTETAEVVLNLKDDGNKSVEIAVTVLNAPVSYELVFSSANESIATVSKSGDTGTITAVAKGETTVTVSLVDMADVTPLTVNVSVKEFRPWSDEEVNAMQEHLYGIVLEPTAKEYMEASWDDTIGQITVEGDEVAGTELAEYAAEYKEADGWINVTHLYSVEEGTAYMFEKAVETDDGTRYVRVFVYATDFGHGDELVAEGAFYIVAYDPYVYAWPEDHVRSAAAYMHSDLEIPMVQAQHYYIYNYSVTAYYASTEADGGYSALLTAEGYIVEQDDGHYRALSPDYMFGLVYVYADGALEITFTYPIVKQWPENIIAKYFEIYEDKGAEKYDIPAFEGEGLSFLFTDYIYNDSPYKDKNDMHGTVTVRNSTQALTTAYYAKLESEGWVALSGETGSYQKEIADHDGLVARLDAIFDSQNSETVIDIYYVLRADANSGWLAAEVASMIETLIGAQVTDVLPAYTGTITAFEVTKDSVYIQVPADEYDGVQEAYEQILTNAGFNLTGTSTWTMRWHSPNDQYQLTLSKPYSRENTLCIYVSKVS